MNNFFKPLINSPFKNYIYKNNVILITGGGTGLGKAMAQKYSELGGTVIICSRNIENLNKAKEDIEKITNNTIYTKQCDITNIDNVIELSEYCTSNNINPNIVINNSAGNFLCPTEKLSLNAFNAVIDIVLKGSLNITKTFGENMIKNKRGGNFLSITTTYANTGSGYVVPSSISKAGVNNLTKSLASEWGKYGIRFNAIAPGPIYTEGAFSRLDPLGNLQKNVTKTLPTGRLGQPEELANLATYITSDYCNWMTGNIVNLDGGELVKNSGEFNVLDNVDPSFWDRIGKKSKL
jgi:2,4-dienoyl-CoA reductase [(3E)-enoyl-CoA-producing], mitochondrial